MMESNWSDAATSQGPPRIARSWQRRGTGSPTGPPEGNSPVDTWVSDFWPPDCERLHFCCDLLWRSWETNTIGEGLKISLECWHFWGGRGRVIEKMAEFHAKV